MKLLLQLAIIAAFATPVVAHAGNITKSSSQDMTIAKKKKKKKKTDGDAAPAPTGGQ